MWDSTVEISVNVGEWVSDTAIHAWDSTEDARLWISKKANEAWISAVDAIDIAGTWVGENIDNAWDNIAERADATSEWICETTDEIQVISADAIDSTGQWIGEKGQELVYFVTSTGEVVAAYVEDIEKEEVVDYLSRSGEKLLLGEYSDEEQTLLSIGGTLAASVVNIDIGMDIRDIVYDVQHLDSEEVGIGDIALSAVGLIPIIGVIKPAKKMLDAADAMSTVVKMADDTADVIKTVDRVAETVDSVNDAGKVVEAANDVGKIVEGASEIAEATSDASKIAEATSDASKIAEATGDAEKVAELASDAGKKIEVTDDVNRVTDMMSDAEKSVESVENTGTVAEAMKNTDNVEDTVDSAKAADEVVDVAKVAENRHFFPEGSSQALKYSEGIEFTQGADGNMYPRFEKWAEATATFDEPSLDSALNHDGKSLCGNYYWDAKAANQQCGYEKTPKGYVWHHVEDMKTMILIPQDLHSVAMGGMAHTGGACKGFICITAGSYEYGSIKRMG